MGIEIVFWHLNKMSKLANLPKMAKNAIFHNFVVQKLNLKLNYLISAGVFMGRSMLVDQIVSLDMTK